MLLSISADGGSVRVVGREVPCTPGDGVDHPGESVRCFASPVESLRSAFPEIGDAKLIDSCALMTRPIASWFFFEPLRTAEHTARSRVVTCIGGGDSMDCRRMSSDLHFVSDPSDAFEVDASVPLDDALRVASAFREGRLDGAPNALDALRATLRLTAIRAKWRRYVLSVGVCGCSGEVEVAWSNRRSRDRLRILGTPEISCF